MTSKPVTFTIEPPGEKKSGPPMWLVIVLVLWVTLVIIGITIVFLIA